MKHILQQHYRALIYLANRISCHFIDARTSSKEYVKTVANRYDTRNSALSPNGFLLSTCLRFEIYQFGAELRQESFLFQAAGLSCLRRLLSILVGLQSEIVGEREIAIQITDAICAAKKSSLISEHDITGLDAILAVADYIRAKTGMYCEENYSSIAADLIIQHLASETAAVIAIVGGGYMADKFFSALLSSKYANIKKVIWINRSISKLERTMAGFYGVIDVDVEILDIDDGLHALRDASVIFAALSHSPRLFADAKLQNGAYIVDVSYPEIFHETPGVRLTNISNTYFDKLIRNALPRSSVVQANLEIDAILHSLELML